MSVKTLGLDFENNFDDQSLLVARRATYVVDGRFFGHFFWKVEGTVRIHVSHIHTRESRTANVQVEGWGFRELNIGKLKKFGKLKIHIKVAGSIIGHVGSHKWQPS